MNKKRKTRCIAQAQEMKIAHLVTNEMKYWKFVTKSHLSDFRLITNHRHKQWSMGSYLGNFTNSNLQQV